MGEIAEMMLNGLLCEQCGCLIDGEETGHPRKCEDCAKPKKRRKKAKRNE
ncbi:hypothetical protein [Sporolactobacillus terrae]|uniref:Uncharacterized protein n=1 Tax=Sporolactobacillus terrae TaxID=269673 RepID=A0A5K7WYQ3_9BACL|nr:hypothetical protein [Sporolactobacillus terrae]BBN97473.1 hypothetical protein St703_01780 [Sporolactobacillus terrae]